MPAIYSGNRKNDKLFELAHDFMNTVGKGADVALEATQKPAKVINRLSGLGPLSEGLGETIAGGRRTVTPTQAALSGAQGIASVAALGGLGGAFRQPSLTTESITKMTRGRPAHQALIEQAVNSKNIKRATEIIKLIPENDPYKHSMELLLKSLLTP